MLNIRPNQSYIGYSVIRRFAQPEPPESIPKLPMRSPTAVLIEEIAMLFWIFERFSAA